jgi:hypothetical protein
MKKGIKLYLTTTSCVDLMKFSKESGVSASQIVDNLLRDAGIARRFFTPNRWGEMLAEPTIKEAITPRMEFEEKILTAKHRVSVWEREKRDLDKFIAETNKIIQDEIKSWKE